MHDFYIYWLYFFSLIWPNCLANPNPNPNPSLAQNECCIELERVKFSAQTGVQGVWVWVAVDEPTILLIAGINLEELRLATPVAGETLNEASRSDLLDLIGSVCGSTLLIVGAPAATLILSGMALSSGLLTARVLTSHHMLNPRGDGDVVHIR